MDGLKVWFLLEYIDELSSTGSENETLQDLPKIVEISCWSLLEKFPAILYLSA